MKVKILEKYLVTLSLVLTFSFSFINDVKALDNNEKTSNETGNEKIVYLTFDDGPGGRPTIEILDILKRENVPATFFVIGDQIEGQEKTILRMKNEGHSIGLHS
ncbi:polysaccharide deacetylase family protein, partial [Clostridium perfringens]|uniref:polysaccharide deacetylase family protein n=2 Tax=Clostridium TaxID=1485 RepID=UPI002AC62118